MHDLLRWFDYNHLPAHLQEVVKPFAQLAATLAHRLPQNPETTTALRKLLESKDCAVRSAILLAETEQTIDQATQK